MHSDHFETVQVDLEEAVGLQRAGQADAAERIYHRVLQTRPDNAEANHNLGIISMQRGKVIEGVAYFKRALEADQERELYRRSYARSLLMTGQTVLAAKVMEEGERLHVTPGLLGANREPEQRPRTADEWLLQGNVLTEEGNFSRAVESFQQAIALNPELSEAYHHLGSLLAETGHVGEGFDILMKRAKLMKGRATPDAWQSEPLHKIKHDGEQRAYLMEQGRVPGTRAAKTVFHLGEGARLAGPALNRQHPTAAVLQEWRASDPQRVVIDDFLTQPALERLRRYCADSTVWRRVYDAGYIGATPADGFACPLLAQITEEISSVYGDILDGHPFRYLGAFKYDSELSTGTNIHADYSAINLNLYIAPDEANLDPDTGGMVLWNVAARDEGELRRYNSDDRAIREHLRQSRAQVIRVAHRANRAVLFKSSLFHRTDTCRFKEGYLNKRINVSFLFGRFGSS
jgi:Flp pilus assembly protein TadD